MLEKIIELVASQLDTPAAGITAETSFRDDLGADSLDLMELIMTIEDEFGFEVPSEDLTEVNTVGDVVEYLKQKGITA